MRKKGLLKRLGCQPQSGYAESRSTLERVSIEAIETAWVRAKFVAAFNSLLSLSPETFHLHSAFYIYHNRSDVLVARALREALCSYYGAAGSLLRGACEAIPERRILGDVSHTSGIATAPTS